MATSTDNESCPFCDCAVRGTKIEQDLTIMTKLRLTVPVRCCMTGKGCDWQGEITQFWEHVSVCEAFPRPCPFECDPKVFMPKQVLNDHLRDKCPMKPVACEYKWAGCTEVCARREMPRHMQDSAVLHNELLNKAAKGYRQVISKLSAEIDTLKSGEASETSNSSAVVPALPNVVKHTVDKDKENERAPAPKRVKFNSIISTTIQSPTSLLPPPEQNKATANARCEANTIPLGFITEEGQQYLKKAVECVSTPEENKKKKVREREPISSPIVKYFYDVRSMGFSCPSDVCVYGKADWRTLMIKCEMCESWYHSKCAKVNNHVATTLSHYTCTKCLQKEAKNT